MFRNQNLKKKKGEKKRMFWNVLGPNLTGQSPFKLLIACRLIALWLQLLISYF